MSRRGPGRQRSVLYRCE